MTLWDIRDKRAQNATFFPCCNPCSISSKSTEILRARTYHICLKSDGIRYVLLLTTRMGTRDAPVAIMMDRSRNMFEVEVVAPERYFLEGTILEGELVWRHPDQHDMIYYVFDAIRIGGDGVAHLPFSERLERASRAVQFSGELRDSPDVETQALETDTIVLTHYEPRIEMRIKHFVSLEHSERLWNDRGDAQHRVDGIILQDVNAPYCVGTALDHSCLKWKDHSTVDLTRHDGWLHAVDGTLPTQLHGRRVIVVPSRIEVAEGQVVEYSITLTETEIRLMAIRTRPDKGIANSLRTVNATVDDVLHEICPRTLASVCRHNGSHRATDDAPDGTPAQSPSSCHRATRRRTSVS